MLDHEFKPDMMQFMKFAAVASLTIAASALMSAAGKGEKAPPEAAISNREIRAQLYLPDARDGYYRGTRFDWSGVIYGLRYKGHDYYGPWFTQRRADVRDFVYEGADIVAGPCSAITGPVEEYSPLGFEEARPGGSFVKIGIGVLKKPDAAAYDHYRLYDVVDPGKWTIHKAADRVQFLQKVDGPDGYAYEYTKTVRLVKDKPEMILEHRLKNMGTRAIKADVYNHNFLVLDHQAPGPGYSITFPFDIESNQPSRGDLAKIEGKRVVYLKTLEGKDTVATPIQGFSANASDYDFRVESEHAGAGIRVRGDQAMSKAALWSIRSVVAVEPYIDLSIEPGKDAAWTFTYDYYIPGAGK